MSGCCHDALSAVQLACLRCLIFPAMIKLMGGRENPYGCKNVKSVMALVF
jgi:hypothetical protein